MADDHDVTYPDYHEDAMRITEWIKRARMEINNCKRNGENSGGESSVAMKNADTCAKEKDALKTEEKYLCIKLIRLIEHADFENEDDINRIEKNLSAVEDLLDEYSDINKKFELIQDPENPDCYQTI